MEPIIYVLGILTGVCSTILLLIVKNRKSVRMAGVMYIDTPNNLAKIRTDSIDLTNPKIKKAVFKVDHRANLLEEESREEHIL